MYAGSSDWPLGVVAIAVAAWEMLTRHNARRWQVQLLATAGLGWLATAAWAVARSRPGVDPSWPILINLVVWPIACLPYVGFRAEEAIR